MLKSMKCWLSKRHSTPRLPGPLKFRTRPSKIISSVTVERMIFCLISGGKSRNVVFFRFGVSSLRRLDDGRDSKPEEEAECSLRLTPGGSSGVEGMVHVWLLFGIPPNLWW